MEYIDHANSGQNLNVMKVEYLSPDMDITVVGLQTVTVSSGCYLTGYSDYNSTEENFTVSILSFNLCQEHKNIVYCILSTIIILRLFLVSRLIKLVLLNPCHTREWPMIPRLKL